MATISIPKESFIEVFELKKPEEFKLMKDFGFQEDGFGYQKSWEHKKIFFENATGKLWCYDKSWYMASQEKDTCKIWEVLEQLEVKYVPVPDKPSNR